MARQPTQPLSSPFWIGLPALVCVAATILLGTPLRVFGLALPEPVFPVVVAFAWAVIRPSILGPFVLLALGLFLDLFWGGPLGLWAASLLAAYGLTLFARSLLVGQATGTLAAWYVAAAGLAFTAAYLFTMLGSKVTPNLLAAGLQLAVTLALFPLAYRLIVRFEDADVRFR